jgi:hypothetical protein
MASAEGLRRSVKGLSEIEFRERFGTAGLFGSGDERLVQAGGKAEGPSAGMCR